MFTLERTKGCRVRFRGSAQGACEEQLVAALFGAQASMSDLLDEVATRTRYQYEVLRNRCAVILRKPATLDHG